jgi:hypothetical protein
MEQNLNGVKKLLVNTTYAKSEISFNDWAKEFKVSSMYEPPIKYFQHSPYRKKNSFIFFIRNFLDRLI